MSQASIASSIVIIIVMVLTNLNNYELKISTLTVASLGLLGNCNSVQAQIISDHTTNTQIKLENKISHIMGGEQAGNNLFHSFKQFSLNTGAIANFDHGIDINNIFSRVTGGNISDINGLIQTQGKANLFLINPAGIIFGADAQLNIGGSFIAATAEQINFTEPEVSFSAINPHEKPILTIASPTGLQYGSASEIAVLPNDNRGTNNSNIGLSIKPGNTLALLGGDISITRNNLNAIASNLEISSIKSGTISLEPSDHNWNFNYDDVLEFGRINLNNRALINSSGKINFQAKTIDFSSGSGIRNFTNLAGEGGIIQLSAIDSVALDSSFLFTQVGQTSSDLEQAISGIGGDIFIQAPDIFLTNGSVISAGTLSEGAGGNITLEGAQTIELSSALEQKPSIISTSTIGKGNGGHINVNAGKLRIYDGSQIQAFAGEGKGGTINVEATELIDISGKGILRSQDNVGNLIETNLNSGFTASSGFEGLPFNQQPQGKSGNLIISTPQLHLAESGNISVNNYGLADAGDIEIITDYLNLDTAGEITANTVSGKGGSISVMANDLIVLDRQSSISTTAQQDGNGGNIFLAADHLLLLEANSISADAQQGSGGNISINTQGLFIEPHSAISASSEINTQAGTIKIITLDLNSRLNIDQNNYSPLVAEDYIYTGCGAGKDFINNRFQNIGRGGIPHNPLQEIANLDVLPDFGSSKRSPKLAQQNKQQIKPDVIASEPPILEANSWQTNAQGKLELIAQHQSPVSLASSDCQLK